MCVCVFCRCVDLSINEGKATRWIKKKTDKLGIKRDKRNEK